VPVQTIISKNVKRMMFDLIGKAIGHYSILERVGRGGMASVYKAKDLTNDRTVAIKILAPQLALDPNFKARFKREAEVLTGLKHPHVVPILDYGEAEGLMYIVMPFMQVGGLSDRLQSGPLEVKEGARLIAQVASALQYAHDNGVVHRDMKPSNILIDEEGNAWLSDFGFAHVQDTNSSLTGSALIGTPMYMAPEQVQGKEMTPLSDQYALAVVLFQVSTGYLPYEADTPMAVAIKHVTEPLPRPRQVNPNLPDAVEAVLIRALTKDSSQRFNSVAEFNQAFQDALQESLDPESGRIKPGARGPDPKTEILKPLPEVEKPRRFRRTAMALLFLLLLTGPLTIWGILTSRPAFQTVSATSNMMSTIDALYTANVASFGAGVSQDEIESSVAGTLRALMTQEAFAGAIVSLLPDSGGTTVGPGGLPPYGGSLTPTDATDYGLTGTVTPTVKPTSDSSPTRTLTLTKTPTRTATLLPVPTSTRTQAPSPTLKPTNTPTISSPPTEDPCDEIDLSDFDVYAKSVVWSLNNGESSTITIHTIEIAWPIGNQKLEEVKIGGETIWEGESATTPITLGGGGQSLSSGASKEIVFIFKKAAESSGYTLHVTMESGCIVSAEE
jgi:serine/threonine protein kinase